MAGSLKSKVVGDLVVKPAVKRLSGRQPTRREALVAAVSVAVGTGSVVYRLLRTGAADTSS